jgi:hypothetical protein
MTLQGSIVFEIEVISAVGLGLVITNLQAEQVLPQFNNISVGQD